MSAGPGHLPAAASARASRPMTPASGGSSDAGNTPRDPIARLMRRVLTEGRRLGAMRATLEVRASNDDALRFYEGLGFRAAGRRKHYYTNPVEDAVILWREPDAGSNRANTIPETGD